MLSQEPCVGHKKSNIIPIKQNKTTYPNAEYGLKQNFFNPTKGSPPNNFMNKLHMRMQIYDDYKDNNVDNLESE